MKKYILPFLLLFALCQQSFAFHIVGGELFYDCLGGNQYQITLKLYRDCSNPNAAQYDSIAYIYVFDSNHNIVTHCDIRFPGSHQVTSQLNNPCLQTTNICVEEAIYTGVFTLNPPPGGYDLSYQRCCRNSAVVNVPNSTGATYTVHMPGSNLATCNSSPRFSTFPPIFICLNVPLIINYSALDPDGDSLVYALADPNDGASQSCPYPNPNNPGCPQPSAPPYSPVTWNSPYNATNPMNNPSNADNLAIDSLTGVMSGIPNQQGTYSVGVSVKEYRNGVLIGSMIRDFQFNVVPCNGPVPVIGNIDHYENNVPFLKTNCLNDSVQFRNRTASNGVNPITYHWDFGEPNRTDDTSNLYSPLWVYSDTGTYYVYMVATQLISGQPCSDTTRVKIKLYKTFIPDFSYYNACQDSAIQFVDLTLSTLDTVTGWIWQFGDGRIGSTATINHQYANPGTYNVTLISKNNKGCVDSKVHTVRAYAMPNINFTTGRKCVFSPVVFTNTTVDSIVQYRWDFGNGVTSTDTNYSLTYNTPGNYPIKLVAVTNHHCTDSITKSVVVNPLPVVNISPDTIICPYTPAQLRANGGVIYRWSPSDSLYNDSIQNPIAKPIHQTTYCVTVTDANSCVDSDCTTIHLYPIPQIDAGLDTSVCLSAANFHNNVQLNATGGVSYTWSPPTGLNSTTIPNPISTPTVNTTYYVLGIDTDGCRLTDSVFVAVLNPALNLITDTSKAICRGDTTTLNVLRQGNSTYQWTPKVGISDTFSNSPLFFPNFTTTYIFSVTNYCYQKDDTATIIVHQLPPLQTEHIDSVCFRDTIQLHASGAIFYLWTADSTLDNNTLPNPHVYPLADHIYYVVGSDTFGCHKSDSVFVHVYYPPTTHVLPDTPFICFGQSIRLTAQGGVYYHWLNPNSSLSDTAVANPIATPADTITYHVRITNIHGCWKNDSLHINVQLPVHAHTASPYEICVGQTFQLHASGGLYYSWQPQKWLNKYSIPNPFAAPDSSITYEIIVSNDCFADTAPVVVTVHQPPPVEAGNDTTIWRDTYAQLNGDAVGNAWWYPGTGIKDPLLLHTEVSPQNTTTLRLYVVDQYGCSNYDSVKITVEPYTIFDLPTGFSPNGDGMNDVFRIAHHLNISSFILRVYNRWGQKLYETDDYDQGWDGKYNDVSQPLGVYVWTIEATTKDGEKLVRSGNITLLR